MLMFVLHRLVLWFIACRRFRFILLAFVLAGCGWWHNNFDTYPPTPPPAPLKACPAPPAIPTPEQLPCTKPQDKLHRRPESNVKSAPTTKLST
jgi:hypothetical protein